MGAGSGRGSGAGRARILLQLQHVDGLVRGLLIDQASIIFVLTEARRGQYIRGPKGTIVRVPNKRSNARESVDRISGGR